MLRGKLQKILPTVVLRARSSGVTPSGTASFKESPNPNLIQHDFVGPPDKLSNLRPIVRHIKKDETPLEKRLRLFQMEIEEYNQKFWAHHNKKFLTERTEFIAANRKHPDETLSADEMSVFYKAFLDRNWKIHVYYNISWYIKNISLMFLALRVELTRLVLRKRKA
ncbi:COA8 family protein CG14806, mitochondrial [Phlebotomus argentipes]|uniref:COA8 family protein CG14806, mitochondrial n=1 Tax=Phlebotomus argentipes TaxID=94469 RepID=UPI002892AD1E|nr:COA8 family protein CG14806, mitochondrial [Phlebotomus argentipes]